MADRMAAQARELEQMQAKMANLEAQISDITAFLKGETKTLGTGSPQPSASAPMAAGSAAAPLVFTDEMFEKYRAPIEAKMKEIVAGLPAYGVNMDELPAEAKAIFDNPVQALKEMQSGKYGQTLVERIQQNQAARRGK